MKKVNLKLLNNNKNFKLQDIFAKNKFKLNINFINT